MAVFISILLIVFRFFLGRLATLRRGSSGGLAVVTLQFIDEDDRHFEHSPFNLPTKAKPSPP